MDAQTRIEGKAFHWLDIVNPTREELERIGAEYGLNPALIHDCLDPEHLPKHERSGATEFVILRSYDDASTSEADTVQELTRKLAIFCSPQFIISIHRKDQDFLGRIRKKWQHGDLISSRTLLPILGDLIRGCVATYDKPIDQALTQLEQLEMGVFGAQGSRVARQIDISRFYFLRRKVFVYRRMLRATIDLLPRISHAVNVDSSQLQDLREEAESSYYYTEELVESVGSLLNLHISLASQKTNEASHRINEVVRVLTIFSVFLLPLNVITGIYGMNFERMPELKWEFGYPAALLAMVIVELSAYLWFRRKGWLK